MQLEESIAKELADIVRAQILSFVVGVDARIAALETRIPEKGDKGDPGDKGDKGDIGPPGQDGKDGSVGADGLKGKDGADGKDGRDGIDGKDGKDGLIGRDGLSGVPGRDGKDGRDGMDGKDGAPGKDGADGVHFDEVTFEMSQDGRSIIERYFKDNVLRCEFSRPARGRFRGAWKHDEAYLVDDTVQCSGSLWCSLIDHPKTKPGDNEKTWQLIVRKGRDGKDGERGPPGPVGPSGKDASY